MKADCCSTLSGQQLGVAQEINLILLRVFTSILPYEEGLGEIVPIGRI